MKNELHTRYIGSSERWLQFWQRFLANTPYFHEFFDIEDAQLLISSIKKVLSMVRDKQNFYQQQIEAYPFDIPASFKDMWLSGTVDIFEIIFNFFAGYRDEFKVLNQLLYFKLFLSPHNVKKFHDFSETVRRGNNQLDKLRIEIMLERQKMSIEERVCSPLNFYKYPHDEAILPIALDSQSISDMYILVDGEIEVDGGALFMFATEPFADGEYEVGVWSDSESSWQRYQTMPEPFLYTLAYLAFEASGYSLDDLIQVNDVFKILYN